MGREAVPGPAGLLLAEEPVSLVPMRFVLDVKGGIQSSKYFPLLFTQKIDGYSGWDEAKWNWVLN